MLNLFLVYQFLKRLATPFKEWEAFKLEIIDAEGNILRSRKSFTKVKEREAFGAYDLMVLNLKKLLGKIPGGKSRIASYAAALYLLKEWNHFSDESLLTESVSDSKILESVDSFQPFLCFCIDNSIIPYEDQVVNHKMHDLDKMFEEKIIKEEPANNVGSGAIAGLGVGPDGEPGLTMAQRIKYIAKNKKKAKKMKKFREHTADLAEAKMDSKYKKIMPSGSKPDPYNADLMVWSKTGGHAGAKSIKVSREKALAAGFKKYDYKSGGNADGSVIYGDEYYKDSDGVVIAFASTYGVTASKNRFSVTLKLT